MDGWIYHSFHIYYYQNGFMQCCSVARSRKSLIWPGKTLLLWARKRKEWAQLLLLHSSFSPCLFLMRLTRHWHFSLFYSSLEDSDGLHHSFPTKIERVVSHCDVNSLWNGEFVIPIQTFGSFIFLSRDLWVTCFGGMDCSLSKDIESP